MKKTIFLALLIGFSGMAQANSNGEVKFKGVIAEPSCSISLKQEQITTICDKTTTTFNLEQAPLELKGFGNIEVLKHSQNQVTITTNYL